MRIIRAFPNIADDKKGYVHVYVLSALDLLSSYLNSSNMLNLFSKSSLQLLYEDFMKIFKLKVIYVLELHLHFYPYTG